MSIVEKSTKRYEYL